MVGTHINCGPWKMCVYFFKQLHVFNKSIILICLFLFKNHCVQSDQIKK